MKINVYSMCMSVLQTKLNPYTSVRLSATRLGKVCCDSVLLLVQVSLNILCTYDNISYCMIRVTTTHNIMTCTSRALERFVDDVFVFFVLRAQKKLHVIQWWPSNVTHFTNDRSFHLFQSRVSILKACLRKSPIAKVCSTNTSLFNIFCYCFTRWELLH